MPTLADITVKKANGSTDITYTGVQRSAGDNQAAIWKETTTGTVAAGQPTLAVVARNNGSNRSARRVSGSYLYPRVRTDANSQTVVKGGISGEFSFLAPQDMTPAEIDEASSQMANLIASALIKSCLKTGYSAA